MADDRDFDEAANIGLPIDHAEASGQFGAGCALRFGDLLVGQRRVRAPVERQVVELPVAARAGPSVAKHATILDATGYDAAKHTTESPNELSAPRHADRSNAV